MDRIGAEAVDRITTDGRSPRCCASPPTEVVPRLAGTTDEIDHDPARAGRRLHPGRAVAARRCAAWSTCCPPAATSTPSTPRRCRPGWPGRPVRRWPIRCWSATGPTRRLARIGRAVGVGHLGDAHLRRRHRRGACAAGCPAGLGRGVPPGDRPGADPAGRAGPAAHRRHRPDLRASSATPSRTWSRCSTTPCALVAGLDEADRAQLRPRPRPGRPRRAR